MNSHDHQDKMEEFLFQCWFPDEMNVDPVTVKTINPNNLNQQGNEFYEIAIRFPVDLTDTKKWQVQLFDLLSKIYDSYLKIIEEKENRLFGTVSLVDKDFKTWYLKNSHITSIDFGYCCEGTDINVVFQFKELEIK